MRILVVDKDRGEGQTLRDILTSLGHQVDYKTHPTGLRGGYDLVILTSLDDLEAIDFPAQIILLADSLPEELKGKVRFVPRSAGVEKLIAAVNSFNRKLSVLVVDDNPYVRRMFRLVLSPEGHEVEAVGSIEEAAKLLKERRFDIAFVDVKLPDQEGIEGFKRLRELGEETVFFMMTGYHDREVDSLLRKASSEDACGYIYKPFDFSKLGSLIEDILLLRRGGREGDDRGIQAQDTPHRG